jgi:catechol 2,3-dioxygenase-like lactoylglutathione lyase family enzyme
LRPRKSVFVLPTEDLAAALPFYRDGLGLEVVEEWTELGRGALLRVSEHTELELIELDGVERPPEPRMGIGLELDDALVDEIHNRLVRLGFRVKGAPELRAWGKRGFGAVDPDGVPVNVYGPKRDV